MPTLKIDFDASSLEAVLSTDQPGSHWEAIRMACQERFPELNVVDSCSFRVAWWAFLSSRKAIAYHIEKKRYHLELSAAAKDQINKANENEKAIREIANIASLPAQQIKDDLNKFGFKRELKSYQLENIGKLVRANVGATFSVPGAGKTTEALAFYILKSKTESRLLVLAPKNAFAAWEEQLALCAPGLGKFVRLVHGRRGVERQLEETPKLMLMTYNLFPNVNDILANYLSQYDAFIFLDESHRIKGGFEKVIASAVLNVAPLPRGRLIMTGTPLPNSVSDLIPQSTFLIPETIIDETNVEQVITPLYVRTTKSQLNLPPVKRRIQEIPLNQVQRELYELMRSEAARQAKKILSIRSKGAFRRIGRSAIRLLQYTSNPALLVRKDSEYDAFLAAVLEEGDSPKISYVCKRARELARENNKVIIWSSFVQNVELIADRLIDLGADFIHGGVEASTELEADSRENKIKRFHDDKNAMILVANPAACSEGISLHTVCNHSIYVDRNYNAAQYLQSQDRIHRIGSTKTVYEEILLSPDTIDNSVNNRLADKINRMADILNDPDLHIDPFPSDLDNSDPDEEDVADFIEHLTSEPV